MSGFDWPALMRVALRGLRMRPRDFWQLTPAELLMMLGEGAADAPMGRARLEELAQAYPDNLENGHDTTSGRAERI